MRGLQDYHVPSARVDADRARRLEEVRVEVLAALLEGGVVLEGPGVVLLVVRGHEVGVLVRRDLLDGERRLVNVDALRVPRLGHFTDV